MVTRTFWPSSSFWLTFDLHWHSQHLNVAETIRSKVNHRAEHGDVKANKPMAWRHNFGVVNMYDVDTAIGTCARW